MLVTAFVVKVLNNQTDLLLEKILTKFCGSTHTIELERVVSNKIQDNKIIKEV